MKSLKETINNFLKKYSTHSQLNALEVLEMIPEKWILADIGADDGLFSFLNSVISKLGNLMMAFLRSHFALEKVDSSREAYF